VKAYNDVKPGDQIECFERIEVAAHAVRRAPYFGRISEVAQEILQSNRPRIAAQLRRDLGEHGAWGMVRVNTGCRRSACPTWKMTRDLAHAKVFVTALAVRVAPRKPMKPR
jgi:hypothetical protein